MPFQHPTAHGLPRNSIIIDGQREQPDQAVQYDHIYPATGRVSSTLGLATAHDVDRAVAAARRAAPAWQAMAGDKRRDLMFRIAALLEQKSAEFAPNLIAENGSIAMTAPYMGYDAAQKFRYFGGWCDKLHGRTIPMWGGPAHDYVSYVPYGVVGIIVPWNGPLFAATMVLAPALAAGNSIVIKAPEIAPYSVMQLVELLHEAGLPNGVVNLVTGGADVGAAMVAHPDIDKIQFIGSGATAKQVLSNAAQSLKPVGLELGGKSAVIVFDDADLPTAIAKGLSGALSSNGQGCINGTRLLVHRSIYAQYVEKIGAAAGQVVCGDPFDPKTQLGPVISASALARIQNIIDQGVRDGGTLIAGGQRLDGEYTDGFFLPVTILADVSDAAPMAQQEIFGPVLSISVFDDEEEAIALANGTEYGLGAYVHTQNLRRAHYMAQQLQAGMIHVNGAGEAMQPNCPFGGVKKSGMGRLGGMEGLHEFLQPKNIWINMAAPAVTA